MELTDDQLVLNVRSGDVSSYEMLFERYQTGIYNFAYSIVRNIEDAKDIVQEAFIKVYKALPKLEEKAKFSSYLYRTARNLAMDELRKKKRRGSPGALDIEEDLSVSSDPQRSLLLKEQQVQVRKAAARLPDDYRMVLSLKELQNLSYDEISSVMEMPKNSIGVLLLRARLRFKQEFRMSQIDLEKQKKECKKILPLLSPYVDNELLNHEREEVKEHLRDCPVCRLALEEITEASKSYRALIPLIPPAVIKEGVLPRISEISRQKPTRKMTPEDASTEPSLKSTQKMTSSRRLGRLSPRELMQKFAGLSAANKALVVSLTLLVGGAALVGSYGLWSTYSGDRSDSEPKVHKVKPTEGGTIIPEWEPPKLEEVPGVFSEQEEQEEEEPPKPPATPEPEEEDQTGLIRQAIIAKMKNLGLNPGYYNITNIEYEGDQATGSAISESPSDEDIHFELEKQNGTWVVTDYTFS